MEITEERIDEIEKAFAVFPLSLLQDFVTFLAQCTRCGISREEAVEYIERSKKGRLGAAERKIIERDTYILEKSPKCPVCGMAMEVEPINDRPDRVVDEESRSWWVCLNILCPSEPIMNTETPREVIAKLGVPLYEKAKAAEGA